METSDYLPFGTRWSRTGGSLITTLTDSTNRWRYSGKEEQKAIDAALPLIDYGARMYDPTIVRWMSVDPMAEKYYPIGPYVYCARNPVNVIDPQGDTIRVESQYQEQFKTDLRNVFGAKSSAFSFNGNGSLILKGKPKDFCHGLTRDQEKAFKGLSKAMNDKTVTSVVYEDYYMVTSNKEKRYVDVVADFGGALTAKEDNLIVVAPSVGEIEVELDYFQTNTAGSLFPTQRVLQNTTSALFHEIGERNTTNTFRGSVIDYENHVRKVIGLPARPYDVTHSYKYQLIEQ